MYCGLHSTFSSSLTKLFSQRFKMCRVCACVLYGEKHPGKINCNQAVNQVKPVILVTALTWFFKHFFAFVFCLIFLCVSMLTAEGRDICCGGIHASSTLQDYHPLHCVWNHAGRHSHSQWYLSLCVCVCVWVRERERDSAGLQGACVAFLWVRRRWWSLNDKCESDFMRQWVSHSDTLLKSQSKRFIFP